MEISSINIRITPMSSERWVCAKEVSTFVRKGGAKNPPLDMDMLGSLRETFTFQFWPREWISRELFIKTLLANFFNALILWFEAEAEFRPSVDEYQNEILLVGISSVPDMA